MSNIVQLKKPPSLEHLATAWLQAKQDEKAANSRRLEVESQILDQTSSMYVDEGTATADAGPYVIKIGFGMTRTIDEVKLAADVASKLPEDTLRRLFVYAPKLDLRELRHLQANEPKLFVIASGCITSKPSKPSIAVQEAK